MALHPALGGKPHRAECGVQTHTAESQRSDLKVAATCRVISVPRVPCAGELMAAEAMQCHVKQVLDLRTFGDGRRRAWQVQVCMVGGHGRLLRGGRQV